MRFYKGIKKKDGTHNGFVEIYDYGLNDYYDLNTDGIMYKMMAVICEDEYIINYDKSGLTDHNELERQIEEECISDISIVLGAQGFDLNIYKVAELSNEVIETLIEVLEELKNYYINTGNDVEITFNNMDHFQGIKYNCNNIDEIVNILESMKDVKTKN